MQNEHEPTKQHTPAHTAHMDRGTDQAITTSILPDYMPPVVSVDLADIHHTAEDRQRNQARARMDAGAIAEYRAILEAGGDLPPVHLVGAPDTGYWLGDGWHRTYAAESLQLPAIPAIITPGTEDDARWMACGSNLSHGLRRTNADKRRAVILALSLPQGAGMSLRELADYCGVSHELVRHIKERPADNHEQDGHSPAAMRAGAYPIPKSGVYREYISKANITTPEETRALLRERAKDLFTERTGSILYESQPGEANDMLQAAIQAVWEAMGDRLIVWRPVERIRGTAPPAGAIDEPITIPNFPLLDDTEEGAWMNIKSPFDED